MNEYLVVDLRRGLFQDDVTVLAENPLSAAELVAGGDVARVTSGGDIVVYGHVSSDHGGFFRSYVYQTKRTTSGAN